MKMRRCFPGLLGMMRDLVPEDPATLLPSWCFILDLLAVLLPEGTIACAAARRMAKAFAEAGICQESLPPALLQARLPEGWHAPEGYAVTYGEEPMWKLIGKKAPQSDRPWLDRRQLADSLYSRRCVGAGMMQSSVTTLASLSRGHFPQGFPASFSTVTGSWSIPGM